MKKVVYYIQSIRWFEIAVRTGAPFLALMLTAPLLSRSVVFRIVHALAAFFFLWTHGYAFNEWAGYASDQSDMSKAHTPLMSGRMQRSEMLLLAVVSMAVSIVLYAVLDVRLLLVAGADIVIGILYVHPRVLLKEVPFLSLIILFLVSIGDFMLGWLIFSPSVARGVLISLYFGILGIVGQSYHEAGDYETDKKAGIRTNAVRFGRKNILITGFVFYTISCMYIALLAYQAVVPYYLCLPVVVTYPLYVLLFTICLRAPLPSSAIRAFIRRYRLLYGLIGAAMLLLLLVHRSFLP